LVLFSSSFGQLGENLSSFPRQVYSTWRVSLLQWYNPTNLCVLTLQWEQHLMIWQNYATPWEEKYYLSATLSIKVFALLLRAQYKSASEYFRTQSIATIFSRPFLTQSDPHPLFCLSSFEINTSTPRTDDFGAYVWTSQKPTLS